MIALLASVAMLAGNAFFVGAELALIATRRATISPLAATSRRARLVVRAMEQLPLMVAGAQLGITICSLGLGALAEPALASLLTRPFEDLGLPAAAVEPVAVVLALGVVVFAHTLFGEMVPKNLALAGPQSVVLWLGPVLYGFCQAFRPLLAAMSWATTVGLRLARVEVVDRVKTVYTGEELTDLASQARALGLLAEAAHARMTGAVALRTRTARDTMRPWTQVITVRDRDSPASVADLAVSTGRSRFPVVRTGGGVGGVDSFVHVKDTLGLSAGERVAPLTSYQVRRLPAVSPDATLDVLLVTMRTQRQHMVLVGDERQPLGVLTLHDILSVIQRPGPGPAS